MIYEGILFVGWGKGGGVYDRGTFDHATCRNIPLLGTLFSVLLVCCAFANDFPTILNCFIFNRFISSRQDSSTVLII